MQCSNLFVGNLDFSVTNTELEELFAAYGDIKKIVIIKGKGFGFVEMLKISGAEKAKEALNGYSFKGRDLNVDEARPPKTQQRDNYRRY